VTNNALAQPFKDLANALESAEPNFQKALSDLENFFITSVRQPADFKGILVCDLLDAIANVMVAALKFADGVIQALLALIEAALDGVQSFLTGKLTIPLLSDLFTTITKGEDLTVAGLISLIAAVPLTIAYKLAYNDNPPFTADQVQQILATSSAGTTVSTLTAQAGVADTGDSLNSLSFHVMGGLIQIFGSMFAAVLDAMDFSEPGSEDAIKFWNAIDIGFPILEQMFSWPSPSGVPFDIPWSSASQKWNVGMWACYWAQPLVDAAMVSFTPKSGEQVQSGSSQEGGISPKMPAVLRYIDPVGKVTLCGIGVITFGVSMTACVLGGQDQSMDAATIAANLLGPLSFVGQPLRLDSLKDSSDELSTWIQIYNDLITGIGCGVLKLVSLIP
jgi:hypothetical protein